MTGAASLIPELEAMSNRADPARRSKAAREIADLFQSHSEQFDARYSAFFDQVLGQIVPRTEAATRAHVAQRLAGLANAPASTVKRLAKDDEISVAGPVLSASPLIDEELLIEIARSKGQDHLSAIATRPAITTTVTDVILRRGDREVVRTVAGNQGATFSQDGYAKLVKRAGHDGMLAVTVGQRADISPSHLKDLITDAVDIVRRRLIAAADPQRKSEISSVIADVAGLPDPVGQMRDYKPAQRVILDLHRAGDLNEAAIAGMARAHRCEEVIAGLAAISGVPIESVDRLVLGERSDPILVFGRGLGFDWESVRAIILLRLGPNKVPSGPDMDIAQGNFERLAPSTAQSVLRFWQLRRAGQNGW